MSRRVVQTDVTLERPSTTDGQRDDDRDSDEHETSRQEQCHHTDSTPDAAAASWPDTAASTFTDHQPHDSTVGDQGNASTTDGQTNVDCEHESVELQVNGAPDRPSTTHGQTPMNRGCDEQRAGDPRPSMTTGAVPRRNLTGVLIVLPYPASFWNIMTKLCKHLYDSVAHGLCTAHTFDQYGTELGRKLSILRRMLERLGEHGALVLVDHGCKCARSDRSTML